LIAQGAVVPANQEIAIGVDKTSDDNLKGWQQYLDATVFSEVSDWTMLPSIFSRSISKSFRQGQRKGRET